MSKLESDWHGWKKAMLHKMWHYARYSRDTHAAICGRPFTAANAYIVTDIKPKSDNICRKCHAEMLRLKIARRVLSRKKACINCQKLVCSENFYCFAKSKRGKIIKNVKTYSCSLFVHYAIREEI